MDNNKEIKNEINEENAKDDKKTAKPKNKKEVVKKKTFKDIKKIMEDAELLIFNNEDAMFFYRCPKTGTEIDFLEYGDTEIVEAGILYTMKTNKEIFNKFQILILDVYCDDDSITLEDVYVYLGIDKLYKGIEVPTSEYLDELLLETSEKKFDKEIDKMKNNFFKRLANRAVMLAKKGEFHNSYKKRVIEERLNMEYLFDDIEKKKK